MCASEIPKPCFSLIKQLVAASNKRKHGKLLHCFIQMYIPHLACLFWSAVKTFPKVEIFWTDKSLCINGGAMCRSGRGYQVLCFIKYDRRVGWGVVKVEIRKYELGFSKSDLKSLKAHFDFVFSI